MKLKKLVVYILFFLLWSINGNILQADDLQKTKKYKDYNVILIIIDALRPDHLGCYGYYRYTSPAIDKIAEESFVFKNAFSPVGYTLPSMTSIFTSLYPNSHRVIDVYKDYFPSSVYTMAEIFKFYDYKTAWFSLLDEPHLDIDIGFGRGFDFKGTLSIDLSDKENVFSWIQENKDNKFFVAMNIRNVHDPYFPKEKYKKKFLSHKKNKIIESEEELDEQFYYLLVRLYSNANKYIYDLFGKAKLWFNKYLFQGRYTKDKLRKIIDLLPPPKRYRLVQMRQDLYFSKIDISSKRDIEYLISLYDAGILETDQEFIKPLLSVLRELNIYEKTILIITADHGEEFGEHGGLIHGTDFYDELINVPLIIKLPNLKGREIKELAQTVDIMPTVFELLKITSPHYIQGKSLFNLMSNKEHEPIRDYVYGYNNKGFYIRDLEWKLISYNEPSFLKLYNIVEDPKEKENLFYKHLRTVVEMEKRIEENLLSLPIYQEKKYHFKKYIDKKTREKIKKTGYW